MNTGIGTFLKIVLTFTIYGAGIIIFFLSITGKVKYGLLFLVPIFPLENIVAKLQQLPLGNQVNDILLIGMLIGWFVYKISHGQKILQQSSYNKVFFLFIFYTYFTLWEGSLSLGLPAPVSALDPRVQNWKNYMIFPVLFFLALNNLENRKDFKKMLIIMCLAMLMMNRSTIQDIAWSTSWVTRTKFHGTFEWLGANEVAAFYATYTFVIIGIFLYIKKKKWKIALGVLILMNSYCLLFLFSRGAYLATVAALLVVGIFRNKIIIVSLIFILLFWQVILPAKVVERIKFTEVAGQLDSSAEKRLEYWRESMEYFKQSPLIGMGFNVLPHLRTGRSTHNIYLETLAEQGIIGLGFLLIIMFLALKRGLRLFKKAEDKFLKGFGLGFSACIVAVIIGNLFGDRWTYLQLGAFFWVLLGMVERGNLIIVNEFNSHKVTKSQGHLHTKVREI